MGQEESNRRASVLGIQVGSDGNQNEAQVVEKVVGGILSTMKRYPSNS